MSTLRRVSKSLVTAVAAVLLVACEPGPAPSSDISASDAAKPQKNRTAKPAGLPPARQLKGMTAFLACVACHSIREGAPHRVGPNLWGIQGQPAGTREGYTYSPALIAAGEAGLVWEQGTLVAWITKTEAMVPGTWMLYHNWLSTSEIQAVAEFVLNPPARVRGASR